TRRALGCGPSSSTSADFVSPLRSTQELPMLEKMQGAVQMGSTLVLWLLIALSVFSIGIVVDRFIYFRRRKIDVNALGRAMVERLRARDLEGAHALLSRSKSVEAEVLRDALAWYHEGPDSFAEVLTSGLKERRNQFEAG